MNRPAVPADVQRALRKEAYFGCCRCGTAILDYHHIIEYSTEAHFRPKDMMALCPTCHRIVSRYPIEKQRSIKENPFNKKKLKADGTIEIYSPLKLNLGSSEIQNIEEIFIIDNKKILSLKNGEHGLISISLDLYDKNNKILVSIIENNWSAYTNEIWDIVSNSNYIKINSKSNNILLKIKKNPGGINISGHLWYNGYSIDIKGTRAIIQKAGFPKITMQGNEIVGCETAIFIETS